MNCKLDQWAAAADQQGTEGEHQHPATELQEIAHAAHFQAHHQLERGHDQAHDDHLGELLLEAVEGVDLSRLWRGSDFSCWRG